MSLISVIVPVYSVEKYLPRCLDSLLVQTYNCFEIILVDDGSKDNSAQICDDYEKLDKRVRVIHQENRGVSAARNRGLDEAKGEYIVFVDGDDWVDPDYLLDLMNSNADFVCHSFTVYDENGTYIKKPNIIYETIRVNNDSIAELTSRGQLGYTFAKRFSRNIIQMNRIRFNETINHTEDTLFIVDYLKHVKTAEFDEKANYNYIKYTTRVTLSNEATVDRLAMVCIANKILCNKLFAGDDIRAENFYYSRISYSYVSYLKRIYFHEGERPAWKYSVYKQMLKNSDFRRSIESEPDSAWKLSSNAKVVNALIEHNRPKLFFACIHDLLSSAKGYFSKRT